MSRPPCVARAVTLAPALALAFALLVAAPAAALVKLGSGEDGLLALAANDEGAYAIVGTASATQPFALVTSQEGSIATRLGAYGERRSRFPDVAAQPGRVVATYGREASASIQHFAHEAPRHRGERFSAAVGLGTGTGPGRLALTGAGVRALAYPDRQGDAVLAGELAFAQLSADGPEVRHLPLDVVAAGDGDGDGVLVLDLAQTRTRTVLRVLGPGAPAEPVATARRVRDLAGTIAVDASGIHVAHRTATGRVVLASFRDGRWERRTLPGPGGARSAPAVGRAAGTTYVAYDQRMDAQQDVFVARVDAVGPDVTQLSDGLDDDVGPHLAATDLEVWVGWTTRVKGRADTAFLDLLL